MTGAAFPLPFAGPGDGLERAVGAQRRVAQVEAEKIEHLADYLNQAAADTTQTGPLSPGGERVHGYGGDGTPDLPEFTVCEVAAALGLSQQSASILVADVLDITVRLPMLYLALHDGRLNLSRLRKVAAATREMTEAQAREADFRLAAQNVDHTPLLARVSAGRLEQILAQVRRDIAPHHNNDDDADDPDTDSRYLDIGHGADGVATIAGELSTEDAARLSQRLRIVIGWLRELGDRRPTHLLRSVATGWIAEPARLATLHQQILNHRQMAAETDTAGTATPGNADTDPDGDVDGGGGEAHDDSTDDADAELPEAYRRAQMPATKLFLHWDRASDTFSLDGIGAITRHEAHQILDHSKVTVTPVIDLTANPTYTGYVAPPRLKEHTALLNAGLCTFPSCGRQARHGEYDHIEDFADGGPTDARNGHRLCKHHHRAKTFTDWRVYTPAPGIWLWRSPKGRHYAVTAGTTTRLDTRPLDWAAHQPAA